MPTIKNKIFFSSIPLSARLSIFDTPWTFWHFIPWTFVERFYKESFFAEAVMRKRNELERMKMMRKDEERRREELVRLFWNLKIEHYQRHNGPKALNTLTHSTPFVQSRGFNKLWNLGQTSAWSCLTKVKKYVEQLGQIHITTLTNPCSHFDKSK